MRAQPNRFVLRNPTTKPQTLMKTSIIRIVHLACLIAALGSLVSCVAGHVDRVEDRYDRRHYSGPGDARENVNDKFRGRRGL